MTDREEPRLFWEEPVAVQDEFRVLIDYKKKCPGCVKKKR